MSLPKYFWVDAINIACQVLDIMVIRTILEKTPYGLIIGRKLNISYFFFFGCKCFNLNNGKGVLGKFDANSNEGIFLG